MPLVKLIRGARYQFDTVLVEKNEVVDVDARTRNRLVKSGYFCDVADHERPAFEAMPEDDGPAVVQGGTDISEFDSPELTGAQPDGGPQGAKGVGTVHRRSGSEIAAQRAADTKAQEPAPDATQAQGEGAEKQEATV